jgi:hypothetical protein
LLCERDHLEAKIEANQKTPIINNQYTSAKHHRNKFGGTIFNNIVSTPINARIDKATCKYVFL